MRRNIMVMVLSDVQFSGPNVRESYYSDLGRQVRTTNESAIRALQRELANKGENLDRIYAFATQTVQGRMMYAPDKKNHPNDMIPYQYNGKEISHLAYIEEQVRDIIPKDRWHIIEERHLGEDNVSLPMNRTLFYTLQIADRIQQDVREIRQADPEAKIVLHADCTGGQRHAIMMLVDIIRLLQYNDVEIGELFYSNWNRDTQQGKVETVNDVYAFYNLIAGAEEFVNFGSVKDMQGYFEHRNISEELQELLEAMAEFADEVKLCRRWRFVDAVDHLKAAVERFEAKWQGREIFADEVFLANDDVRLNDMLMFQLLPQIHKDYGQLLQESKHTSLDLIRWCLQQNLLQQALTLYTEGIPDILFDRGLIAMTDEPAQHKNLEKIYKKHGGELTQGFYFLNHFGYSSPEAKKEHDKKVSQNVQAQTSALKILFCEQVNKCASVEMAEAAFRELDEQSESVHIQGIHALGKIFSWLAMLQKDNERIHKPGSYRVLQQTIMKMYWRTLNKERKADKPKDWDILSARKKCKRLTGFLKGNITEQNVVNLAGGIGERGSFNIRWRLFAHDDFIIRTDPQQLYHFLDEYAVIKNERNHANHAKEQQGVFDTAESLMSFMWTNLKQLTSLKVKNPEE